VCLFGRGENLAALDHLRVVVEEVVGDFVGALSGGSRVIGFVHGRSLVWFSR
jgi:hypothetical protein